MGKDKEVTRLDRLVAKAVAAQERMAEIEEENEEVFTEWRELDSQVEGYIEQIKIEARKSAVEGDTKVLVENPNIMVSVTTPRRQMVFDFEAAKTKWPAKIFNECRATKIDAEKAKKYVEDGTLKLKQLEGVLTKVEQTPRVTTKLTKRT